jgi:hypothetical protein
MTTNADGIVHDAGCGAFAGALTVHFSRRRVLKFCMTVNALNPTLFDLSHYSPHAKLKGMTS